MKNGKTKLLLDIVQPDLKRFAELKSRATFILDGQGAMPIDQIPVESSSALVGESFEPNFGEVAVRFRKGSDPKAGDKELYIEVWTQEGFVTSLKVDSKVTKVYNDSVFGGISWSKDCSKICFVGEVPAIAKYEAFFKDEAEEEKKEEPKHW